MRQTKNRPDVLLLTRPRSDVHYDLPSQIFFPSINHIFVGMSPHFILKHQPMNLKFKIATKNPTLILNLAVSTSNASSLAFNAAKLHLVLCSYQSIHQGKEIGKDELELQQHLECQYPEMLANCIPISDPSDLYMIYDDLEQNTCLLFPIHK